MSSSSNHGPSAFSDCCGQQENQLSNKSKQGLSGSRQLSVVSGGDGKNDYAAPSTYQYCDGRVRVVSCSRSKVSVKDF